MTATVVRSEPVDAAPLPGSGREAHLLTSEVVLLLAVLLGWGLLYLFALSGFEAGHTQARLYDSLRSELAAGLAPTGAPVAEGAPIALVDAPAGGIRHEVVVEGATAALLRGGPGHVRGTVLPGQAGTSVVAGRSLSFGAPFREVSDLAVGARVVVRTQQGRFDYRVIGVRRSGDPIPPVPAGGSRLVLVTSAGGNPLSRSTTVYVDADLAGTAVAAGPVEAVDPGDAPMSRDAGLLTLALLALALQVLVLALGWFVWARLRWSVVAAWTTGLPVLLAALWIVSSVASRLLPNLV